MIQLNDKGNNVKDLQIKLKSVGYSISIDGIFGPQTQAVVVEFQKNNNLKPDGVVGSKTMEEIDEQLLKLQSNNSDHVVDGKWNGIVVNDFKTGYVFLLDPGHGGIINGKYVTPGKRSPEIPPGVYEGVVNRKIVARLINYCEDNKISYANIVPELEDISLGERTRRANKISSLYKQSIYTSVHCNAVGKVWNDANGIETFVHTNGQNKSIAEFFQNSMIQETNARDRGVKMANFFVLRRTTMPSVLLECGFMTNLKEAKLLATDEYVDKLAYSIARAMLRMNKRL